ncbi:hypothetical protein N0V85_005919 [Neurospora sp. IMI 360204]|nr:hypothetical protein N0V85_005919 [Neurospora sp. IMI 360204]
MDYEEIGAVFEKWNGDKEKPLRDNFLIHIGADICQNKDEKGNYVLANDKSLEDLYNAVYASFLMCCFIQGLHVLSKSNEENDWKLDFTDKIAGELAKTYPAVVLNAIEFDLHAGALGASLEYYKYSGSTELPTKFQEAELDYLGAHMFDQKTAQPGKPVTGDHHFEWKPARGVLEADD